MNRIFSLSLHRLFCLLLLAFPTVFIPLSAQMVTVSGTVTDGATRLPLVGATVAVPEDGTGAYTDETGAYSLRIDLKDRPAVNVIFSYTGYAKEERSLTADLGTEVSWEVVIVPENYTTEDVVITASRSFEQKQSDVTVSIEVVKADAIDLQATADITKVITQIPGVDVLDDQVNIRGSSGFAYGVGSRVMVMLNGLPLLSGDAATAELKLLPVDNVSQIEVVKGASSVLYGSAALGGVINVLTSDPVEKPQTSVRLRTGMYDTPRFKALDWDGSSSAYNASAHIFHSRKIGDFDLTLQTDVIKNSGYRQGTDQELYRGYAMLRYRPKGIPGLNVGMNVSGRIDSSGSTLYWQGYYPDTTQTIVDEDTFNTVSGGALTPTLDGNGARKQITKRLALDPFIKYLTPNGNLFWYRGRFLNSSSQNNTNQGARFRLFYNDFLYQTTLFDKINWVTGATYTHTRVDGAELYSSTTIVGEDTLFNDGIFTGNSLGLYTQLDGKFGKLNTSLGFRYETVTIDTLPRESRPIIRVGLNYEIVRGTNIRASFGQAFRVPSVAERYVSTVGGGIIVEPNPGIKSESGYSAEVGLRQGFQHIGARSTVQGYLDVAAFTMRYDDMVEFGIKEKPTINNLVPVFSSLNVADARINGIELTLAARAKWNHWFFNISGGFTYIDPVNLNAVPEENQMDLSKGNAIDLLDTTKVDQPGILKYRTKWTTRASASVGYKDFSLTSNFRYRSFMETIDQYLFLVVQDLNDFREKHPRGDKVVDFVLAYDINKNSTISFNIDNAFNEEYLIIPGFLAEQREFTIQYQFKF